MNRYKYFKVVEFVRRDGVIKYKVFGTQCKFSMFFGLWVEYQKENETLVDAISQIEYICKCGVESKHIVYKTDIYKVIINKQ